MSIAMLSHAASPDAPTGAERSLALLAAGLRQRGHRVGVVVPGPWCLAPGLREEGVEIEEIPCRVCWLTYHDPISWPRAAMKWLRFAAPDSGGFRILRWLLRWNPDLVHVNCLPHLRGARAAAHPTLDRPVVWHLREILPRGDRRHWFSRRLRDNATRIVSVSEAVGRWVRDEGLGDRLEVVPNGADVAANSREQRDARAALGLPEEGYLVAMFGQLLPHKGGGPFIAAAGAALGSESRLRFVLAGPGPAEHLAELRDAIRASGHEDRIHLLPPQPTAADLLAAADAACLPTLSPDPFPRSVLEAMTAGLPVAAFRGGGVEEMVRDGETGLLVDSGDVRALGAAFSALAGDPEASRGMGAAGRRRALDEFSVRRHVDRMEQLFRGLVEER